MASSHRRNSQLLISIAWSRTQVRPWVNYHTLRWRAVRERARGSFGVPAGPRRCRRCQSKSSTTVGTGKTHLADFFPSPVQAFSTELSLWKQSAGTGLEQRLCAHSQPLRADKSRSTGQDKTQSISYFLKNKHDIKNSIQKHSKNTELKAFHVRKARPKHLHG